MFELAVKARAEGMSFEDFWERAVRPGQPALTPRRLGKGAYKDLVGAIIWPSDTAERDDAQEAMFRCKDVWGRAYDREPMTPGDQAIALLYAMWSEQDTDGLFAQGTGSKMAAV